MNNFLMVVLTELPEDINQLWNMEVLGYTTIGAIATFIGGFIYTLIRAKIQRKAISSGLTNTTIIENQHYKEFLEYKINAENRIKELEEDNYILAQSSFRKEAKEIANKYLNRAMNKEKEKELLEKAKSSPIVNEVVEHVKKKFR